MCSWFDFKRESLKAHCNGEIKAQSAGSPMNNVAQESNQNIKKEQAKHVENPGNIPANVVLCDRETERMGCT
jgi:hypothetical protein